MNISTVLKHLKNTMAIYTETYQPILYVCLLIHKKLYYYLYRAFGGQNKIVYSTWFVTRKAILLLLPGLCDMEGNDIIIARTIICDLDNVRRWSLYACAHSVRAVCKQTKWQPAVTHDRKRVRWHTKPYINNDKNSIWFFVDWGNIVSISGNIFLYPPRGHPISCNYSSNDNVSS